VKRGHTPTESNKKVLKLFENLEKECDQLLAFYNIIKIAGNLEKFKKWLKEYHSFQNIEKSREILRGYQFFLKTCIISLIESLMDNLSLGLKEDFTFYRARFAGVSLEDIPNTCDKVIIIKNIWKQAKPIFKAKNWTQLKTAIESFYQNVLYIFEKIYQEKVDVNPKIKEINIKKEEALNAVTIFYTHIFLNDTSNVEPKGCSISILIPKLTLKYLSTCFTGYKYSLQFLWYELLKENFNKICLKNLHKAEIIYQKETKEMAKEPPFIPVSKRQQKNLLEICKKWLAIDMFFPKIREEIIKPLEQKLKVTIGFNSILLLKKPVYYKKLFGKLLSKVEEPQYLTKNDKKSLKKKLDYILLWYPHVEILDTMGMEVFNGVPAFITTLTGAIELKRIFKVKEKVFVARFKHPTLGPNKNNYSYGILIEAFGSTGITDYSGWLIFFNCCTDYSGFGSSEHMLAETFIDIYQKRGQIEVREITIDKEIFLEFLKEKTVEKLREEISKRLRKISKKRKKSEVLEIIKGKMLELLTYYYLSKLRKYKDIEWDERLEGKQIDIIATSANNEKELFECKTSIHQNYKKIIKNLKAKQKLISKHYKCPLPRTNICVWNEPNPQRKMEIQKEGIKIISLQKIISQDPIFKYKEKEKISKIFST